MKRFFDFYDPLEKRYVFNSFLVVVGLVELLILIFTLIWQMDEGIFTGQVKVVPFPWTEYLLAAFTAPIALLFLFGLIIQGFERICRERPEAAAGGGPWAGRPWRGRGRFLLGLAALLVILTIVIIRGGAAFSLITTVVKGIGLGGTYVLIALMALALLYLPLRLLLRYRLQKKAMEYQYLLELAQRHGLVVVDPQLLPELAASLEEKKNAGADVGISLPAPEFSKDPNRNKSDL